MKQRQRFPPRVPDEPALLDRAIMLLGSRVKQDLRAKQQTELAELLGKYPSAQHAAVWKAELKALRRDEIFDPSPQG